MSVPWATARLSWLLSRRGSAVTVPDEGGDTHGSEETSVGAAPVEAGVDESVILRENVHLGPFQMEIIKGKVKPLLGETAHVMITPLKLGVTQPRGMRPLSLGLHILHTFMHLRNGSDKVSVVV